VLDIPVAEVSLQGSGVVPFVSQRIAAGVPQHVRVGFEAKTRLTASALDHACEASGAEGRPTLRREHEGRLGVLLALKAPQGSQFIAKDRMGAWRASFDPANVQRSRSELNLVPAKVYKLRWTKAVAIGHEDHCRVPMPPTVLPGGVHQPLDLGFRQMLTGPQFGSRFGVTVRFAMAGVTSFSCDFVMCLAFPVPLTGRTMPSSDSLLRENDENAWVILTRSPCPADLCLRCSHYTPLARAVVLVAPPAATRAQLFSIQAGPVRTLVHALPG
jgi:hypothetical protein